MHPASSFHIKKEDTLIETINASCRELLLEGVHTLVGSFSFLRQSMSFEVLMCYHHYNLAPLGNRLTVYLH